MADVHGPALPLRPRVVEHPGGVYRDLGSGDAASPALPGAGPCARRVPPRDGPARSGLQVRAGGARLPEALLGRLSRGQGVRPGTPRQRPARVCRRDLQRAEHEPDERRIDDQERHLRHRLSARRPRWIACDGVAARCVRSRPAVPGDHGGRGHLLELVGSRSVPRVGPSLGTRSWPDAVRRAGRRARCRRCSSRWSSTGSHRAVAHS